MWLQLTDTLAIKLFWNKKTVESLFNSHFHSELHCMSESVASLLKWMGVLRDPNATK